MSSLLGLEDFSTADQGYNTVTDVVMTILDGVNDHIANIHMEGIIIPMTVAFAKDIITESLLVFLWLVYSHQLIL